MVWIAWPTKTSPKSNWNHSNMQILLLTGSLTDICSIVYAFPNTKLFLMNVLYWICLSLANCWKIQCNTLANKKLFKINVVHKVYIKIYEHLIIFCPNYTWYMYIIFCPTFSSSSAGSSSTVMTVSLFPPLIDTLTSPELTPCVQTMHNT